MRNNNEIKAYLLHLWEKSYIRGFSYMILFGLLSLLLSEAYIIVPGPQGFGIDLKEIAILLSVVYLPHWAWIVGIALISSLYSSFDSTFATSVIMHSVAMFFVYFIYRRFLINIKNTYLNGILWVLLVIFTYVVVLIPVMVVCYYLFGSIAGNEILYMYQEIIPSVKYEMYFTALVIALMIVSLNLRNKLVAYNKELVLAKQKAEESDRLKSAFLNNISHEIRTPLNAINVSSEIIFSEKYSEDDKDFILKNIHQNSNELLEMMDQIIEFSKLESGAIQVEPSKINVGKILEDIASAGRVKLMNADKERIEFNTGMDSGMHDLLLTTNVKLLMRILTHLVDNAVKFTSEGSITVAAAMKGSNTIRFSVSDTGVGISREHQEEIFNRFFQVDEFNKGVGISLSLVKRMTEILQGEINLESEVNKGTTFYIDIPVDCTAQ